jgi:hypothetical protein
VTILHETLPQRRERFGSFTYMLLRTANTAALLVFLVSSPAVSNSETVEWLVDVGAQMLGSGYHLTPLTNPAPVFEAQWYDLRR